LNLSENPFTSYWPTARLHSPFRSSGFGDGKGYTRGLDENVKVVTEERAGQPDLN
jgi:hypothetical protein